jgi:hypothetical protein
MVRRERLEFLMRIVRTAAALISSIVNVYIFWKVFLR